MRTARVLGGVALAAAVICLDVPAAAADDVDVWATPYYTVPGMSVSVTTSACGRNATYSKGQSEAGGQINLVPTRRPGLLSGTFVVPRNTPPGWYRITVRCPPRTQASISFRVDRFPRETDGIR